MKTTVHKKIDITWHSVPIKQNKTDRSSAFILNLSLYNNRLPFCMGN